MNRSAAVDPVTVQVVRFALEQIADEMGRTMVRTARSTIIREVEDLSCALFDAAGRTIAQAHHAPMLLTGFELSMGYLLRKFPAEALSPGDVIIANDPYQGGQHIMDIQTMAPVFFKGELVGWTGVIAHHQDIGGAVPGGVAGGMTEVYAEGLRMPMVKLCQAGADNTAVWEIIQANTRVPEQTLGDIRSQVAANRMGVRRLQELMEKLGPAKVLAAAAEMLNYSERRMRQAFARIPDGEYVGTDFVDDDGVSAEPVPLKVTVRVQGDEVTVDFTGSSPQVRGNVNCPVATAHAAVNYTLIAVADPETPPNSGCYRPIHLHAPVGSLLNPQPPAALAARSQTAVKIVEAMLKALAQAVPEQAMAGSHGNVASLGLGGYDPERQRRWLTTDMHGGGAGARPGRDARDGQDSHLALMKNTPVEATELEYPLRVERYELIPDSAGAGQWRGALGIRKDIRILNDDTSFARYSDRHKFGTFGLFGGCEGAPGSIMLNPGTERERRLASKGLDYLQAGDLLSVRLPAGGGYGPPEQRDPELVLADVEGGKLSVEDARRIYKVVIDPDTLALDGEATKAARQS